MNKIVITIVFLVGFTLSAENTISISTKSDKVIANIAINPDEHLILDDRFLFLNIKSDHYTFLFDGFPDGKLQNNGDIYYFESLELTGKLILKDGLSPDDYDIEVILGYQTCDVDGYKNIPVEVSQNILVKSLKSLSLIPIITGAVALICLILIFIKRKKS